VAAQIPTLEAWWLLNGVRHLGPVKGRRKARCGVLLKSGKMRGPDVGAPCPVCDGKEPPPPPPPPKPRARTPERSNFAQAQKRRMAAGGLCRCERCGFAPPRALAARVLNLHHIVPVAAGGSDDEGNLVLLCANCHALTHAVCQRRGSTWYGPKSRDDFFAWVDARLSEWAEATI
jgi:hypothetical protein